MSSVYPGSLDAFTAKTDGVDYNLAAHINDLQDAVTAVQTELGLDPAGSEADVAARFDALQDAVTAVQTELGLDPSGSEADVAARFDALDALIAILGARFNGWVERSETWTRTGNYTFTVAGDLTAIYRKGTKVRYKDGGSYEYGVVISSSYSAPNTTVTLATNDDYAMAAATITDTAISYTSNPEGFPRWFNFATTVAYSASGSMTYTSVTTTYAKFRIEANVCYLLLRATGSTGGTASNKLYASPPVTIYETFPMMCSVRDATSGDVYAGTGAADASINKLLASKINLANFVLGTGRIMHISGFFTF